MNIRDMLPPEQLPRSEQASAKLSRTGAYSNLAVKSEKRTVPSPISRSVHRPLWTMAGSSARGISFGTSPRANGRG